MASGDWIQVGENLVRHRAGSIYLRAWVGGKVIRKSLKTADLRIAKLRRDEHLDRLRSAVRRPDLATIRTLGDALAILETSIVMQPQLGERTVEYYREICRIMRQTLPIDAQARSWTAAEAAMWWKRVASQYSAQRANNVLGVSKRLGALLVSAGVTIEHPTAHLKRRRIEQKALTIPSRAEVDAITESIRSQCKAASEEAADFVAFLAFSGCRVGQARALRWSDIREGSIEFRSGVSGAKGARTRHLPISEPLAAVIARMRARGDVSPSSPVMRLRSPHESLRGACRRLGLPILRIHDLRHFFATWCLQSGVDAPTIAKWLGHKDGGVLVLRVYGHIRDDHSVAEAKRLK